jgi:glycerol-3-phosphate acyltransferase PlsY
MTAAQQQLLILVPIAYVLGSIPFGLIVGLSKGIDPRKAGSGNIGASNVGRLLGGRFFAIVFVLDLLKGLVPTLAASWVVHHAIKAGTRVDATTYGLWLLVAFATIFGHMFSLFLKFTGGKGVATSVGVMVGVFPDFTYPGAVVVLVWSIAFLATRIISLGSVLGAVTFPAAFIGLSLLRRQPVLGDRWPLLAFAVVVGGMVIWKHRGNIARLRAGTEPRFVKKTTDPSPT